MATYYVAEGGTAANKAAATSGTYPGGCMSPAVHNGETFSAGDSILFSDEGGVIRATITPPSEGSSGSPITYGAKSGDSPVISGADLVTGWTPEGTANIWEAALTTEPNQVYMDGTFGDERSGIGDMSGEYDWYWSSNVLYVYAATDPDARYTSPGVAANVRSQTIQSTDNDYLTFQNITCQYAQQKFSGAARMVGITCQDMVYQEIGQGTGTSYINGLYTYGVDDLIVRRCTAYKCGWNGMSFEGGNSATALINIVVEQNECYENGHNGIDFKPTAGGIDVIGPIIRHNLLHNNYSNGMILWNNDTAGDYSIDDAVVYGNVIYGNAEAGINIGVNSTSLYHSGCLIYNNTIYGNGVGSGANGPGIFLQGTGCEIKNNIISENQQDDGFDHEILTNDDGGDANVVDYNVVYNSSHANIYKIDGSSYTAANIFSSVGMQEHGVHSDPLFTNAGGEDFTLTSSSPAKGTAVNLGASYDDGLRPGSSWTDAVLTGDRDNY